MATIVPSASERKMTAYMVQEKKAGSSRITRDATQQKNASQTEVVIDPT